LDFAYNAGKHANKETNIWGNWCLSPDNWERANQNKLAIWTANRVFWWSLSYHLLATRFSSCSLNKAMKTNVALLLVVATGAILLAVSSIQQHRKETKEIQWVGHPMVSDNDHYTPSEGWLSNVQIGLHPNGTVIWRKVKQ